MKNIILILVAVVVVIGAWLLIRKPNFTTPPPTSTATSLDIDESADPTQSDANTSGNATTTEDLIHVGSPSVNASVTSPLAVSGQARGNWFFEASAPVRVTDKSGTVLGESHIQATGDWMTTEFVPFTGSISYELPSGATSTEGFVVFMNDNPSGDPSRDMTMRIPVTLR